MKICSTGEGLSYNKIVVVVVVYSYFRDLFEASIFKAKEAKAGWP